MLIQRIAIMPQLNQKKRNIKQSIHTCLLFQLSGTNLTHGLVALLTGLISTVINESKCQRCEGKSATWYARTSIF